MFKNFSMKATKKHERTTAITVLTSTELLIRELNYCTFQFFGKQNINAILVWILYFISWCVCTGCSIWKVTKVNLYCGYVFRVTNLSLQIFVTNIGLWPNSPAPLTDNWKVMDNLSINFHDVFFFIFCYNLAKNEEKHIMEIYG